MAKQPLFLLILLGLALAASTQPGWTQAKERAQLDRLQKELEDRAEQQRRLAQEAATAGRQAEALSREMSALATDIQAGEERATRVEEEIARLEDDETDKIAALKADRLQLSRTLAALQRLSQRPPQAALLAPGDAVEVVRSGNALSALTPMLRARAAATRRSVEALRQVQATLSAERATLTSELRDLGRQQGALAVLLDRRNRRQSELTAEADAQADRIAKLAGQAESLQSLVARLEQEALEREARRQAALNESATAGLGAIGPLEGLPRPDRRLPLPARGKIIQRFGDPLPAGEAIGITIATRSQAQVVAPFDGRIVFAGRYRHYGRLLIIEHGDGYHSVLAGFDLIYGAVGQWVLAGEPVGAMADSRQASAAGDAELTVPELYLELRRQGQPINPLPWLSAVTDEVG